MHCLLTESEKATWVVAAVQCKILAKNIEQDLDAFHTYRAKAVQNLAAKHDKKPEYIKALLTNTSQFTHTCEESMHNALIHDISVKAKAAGEPCKLAELQACMDVEMDVLRSVEEDEHLIAQLQAHCEHKRKGLCATNIVVVVDMCSVVSKIQDELANMYEHMGARGFAFVTRGNIDNTFMPMFVQSGDAIFEQRALTRDQGMYMLGASPTC
ncbi:hypothetical protein B0H10DRAFT_2229861 [Mycena sp. CBHHK59/15]|nr:hypothetical protein B0H10DRAFT_2229861 [Mycena sp. CBHHK59/15]